MSSSHPELRHSALVVLSGVAPLEQVFGLNQRARENGLQIGMSKVQAESFSETSADIKIVRRERDQEEHAFAEVTVCADSYSPRVQAIDSPQEFSSGAQLVLDIANSERLFGSAKKIAEALLHDVEALGYEADIAVSSNASAALLAAAGYRGITIIADGGEAEVLARLPLAVLSLEAAQAEIMSSWGVHTLGQLAALPVKPLIARMGQDGHRLHQLARGAYDHLLVPEQDAVDIVLVEQVELEHPVELLEPLLFLMSRALEQIIERADQRALAIASVETCLVLDDAEHSEHKRTVRPALPERDSRTLLKLIQLDLELHPPALAIAAFTIRAWPARPPKVQQGLFAAQAPESGKLEVLLARLRKLVGEDRVGAPELLDTHAPEAFRVKPFAAQNEKASRHAETRHAQTSNSAATSISTLRVMRPPLAVHIGLRGVAPENLQLAGKRYSVESYSGPWRTNGAWWTHPEWCREEWDVVLQNVDESHNAQSLSVVAEHPQRCLRLAHDPSANCWYVIGTYD